MKSNADPMLQSLADFSPITLAEMEDVKLMDRKDIKFLFNADVFTQVMEELKVNYRILEIENRRQQHYVSLYFDTKGYKFYLDHHNGKSKRHKVRFRKYTDSRLYFLEVKYKNNKGRTRKKRINIEAEQFDNNSLSAKELGYINEQMGYDPGELKVVLFVEYTRMTLVHNDLHERITIDIDLNYRNGDDNSALENVVIAEVKQDRLSRSSDFVQVMNQFRIFEGRFSKCCFGINALYPDLKLNRFKPRITKVNKISSKKKRVTGS